MKAFNPQQKDKLILTSLIEEDLPTLFFKLSGEFKDNILYMRGISQKWGMDYENTRKYYKNELKEMISESDYKAVVDFFDALSDKLALSDEKNLIIYSLSFLYRFVYNIYFLNDRGAVETINKAVLARYTPEDMQPLFNKASISVLKSISADYEDTQVQSSLVVMSEIFYYMVTQKMSADEYRESVTHGITGCFLLEDEKLEQIVNLSNAITVHDFFNIFLKHYRQNN